MSFGGNLWCDSYVAVGRYSQISIIFRVMGNMSDSNSMLIFHPLGLEELSHSPGNH